MPHHPRRKKGYTHDEYMSLDECIVLCGKCNFMESKGYKLCPNCKRRYYKPKRGREPLCWTCFSETSFGQAVKNYYDRHHDELKIKRKRKR